MKAQAKLNLRNIKAFHARLHGWYAISGRQELPWRNTADPYRIWLSEVMLQQTQVETVRQRFYEPFLKRFPDLSTLAAAPREDVLKAWQGLGYYSRAVNLHKAAQACGPRLPETVEGLLALPGVGRNTAHAVAAFAYRLPVPVMEANVKRVLARIFAVGESSWEQAEQLLDAKNPFDYNQAMMDLGALVCTRRKPKCGECPASRICEGKEAPELYPAARAKKKVPVRKRRIIVLRDAAGRVYATPRTTRFLGGMYHFPELALGAKSLTFGGTVLALDGAMMLGRITHEYSHFRLEAEAAELKLDKKYNGPDWHLPEELARLPHSRTEEKILKLIRP